VDWLAAQHPAAKLVGAPIAGFEFYAWPNQGPDPTSSSLADSREVAVAKGAYNKLWDSFISSKCSVAHSADPGARLLPCFSYRYVKSSLFIIEAQADSKVVMLHDWVPKLKSKSSITPEISVYMSAYAANQSQCFAAAMTPKSADGVFNPSCFIHTGFSNNITFSSSGEGGGGAAYWLPRSASAMARRC
jgi:hypothetical protein